jgi:hypothetical protein
MTGVDKAQAWHVLMGTTASAGSVFDIEGWHRWR